MKKIILTCLLVLWLVIIFIFSNQNGSISKKMSDTIVNKIDNKETTKTNSSNENKKENRTLILIVRKGAHFFEYFILGALCYLVLKIYGFNNKSIIISISLCFIYACSDEIHQLFLDGRTARVIDVFIDTCGGTLGSLLIKKFKS